MARAHRVVLLDALRLIAAVSVVLFHLQQHHSGLSLFSRSYVFVDFFFMLSGFVLTLAAEDAMRRPGGLPRFLRARAIRLWPTIAIGALLGGLLRSAVTGQSLRWQVLWALLLLPDFRHGGLVFPINGPMWTMLLEIVANVLHAVVLCRLADRTVLALALAGAATLIGSIAWFGSATFGPDAEDWLLGFARIGFAYPLGMVMARRFKARPVGQAVPWLPALLLPLAAILLLPLVPLPVSVGDALMIVLVLPPLLWLAATARPPLRAMPWLGAAGVLSFPLYAVHLPILEFVVRLRPGTPGVLLVLPACLLAAAVVALVIALPGVLRPRRPVAASPA